MTTSTEPERAAFEAWWASEMNTEEMDLARTEYPMTPPEKQMYKCMETERAWLTWQAARRAPAVPQGWKLVPTELLERATESLGSFVSDHGWGQADMDTFDDLSALAAAPHPPEAQSTPTAYRADVHVAECIDEHCPGCCEHSNAPDLGKLSTKVVKKRACAQGELITVHTPRGDFRLIKG